MTTRASWYLKGKTSLDLNEEEMMAVSQLDHMQTICTSLQTDDHTNTPSLIFFRLDGMLFLAPSHFKQQNR